MRDQAGVAVETLVVDNGSQDGTLELLRREAVPHVALPENVGFAAAVNLGAARTGARFVFVLNADAVLEPGCLGLLAAALAADASLGAVQPLIRQAGSAPPRVYSAGQRLLSDGRAFEAGAGRVEHAGDRVGREVFGVCGAACLLRRELFSELGGYDERYFAFHEDVDLNARARLHGWRARYVPDAVVWHVGAAAWSTQPARPVTFNTRLMARNRLATDIKVLPMRSLPLAAVAELGSIVRSVPRGALGAALHGRLAALRWLRPLLAERRALRGAGRAPELERWLEPAWRRSSARARH